MHPARVRIRWRSAAWLGFLAAQIALAHDHTAQQAERRRREAQNREIALARDAQLNEKGTCQLNVRLRELPADKPLAGLLRITNLASGKPLALTAEIHRDRSWYSVRPQTTVAVPRVRVRVESVHGLETERAEIEVDLSGKAEHTVDLQLMRIADPRSKQLRSGNTHLHLMKMSYPEALQYLQLVPQSDGLDLVYLSHLRRIPDERDYISNQIVENSFAGGDLKRLSQDGVLFGNGQEHRHNFGRGGEGFGHVMLLDLQRLIHPVSIGPGIMATGTDSQPLRAGIDSARRDGATVVWCHNTFGYEDLPNWANGLLHAQNIFDGGEHGSYRDTYYRYLNLGWRVPFSTGTDWFIYDFSRVYVPVSGPLSSTRWLAALRDGRSFITNGPLLEFQVNERPIGDTIELSEPSRVTIRGRAIGRNSFRGLELVHNGEVIHTVDEQAAGGHFVAEFEHSLRIDQPGWLALRIPLDAGKNEFERAQFAHTSAIYLELAGQRIFRPEVAQQLLDEMERDLAKIHEQATFATPEERESVERVYRDGMSALRDQLSAAGR
jgi:hypothetical protein